MKKVWKILGAAALTAGLVPFRVSHDEETGEKTCQALLWKATVRPAPDGEGRRLVSIDVGFPKNSDPEADLFEDDASWCCSAPVEEAEPDEEESPF